MSRHNKSKSKTKTLFRLGAILAVTSYTASNHFYKVAVSRSNQSQIKIIDDIKYDALPLDGEEWLDSVGYEIMTLTSYDKLELRAYYIPAIKKSDRTVIIAHGYGMNARSMCAYAKFYREKLGYNILMPDARGHGMSDGDYKGFGWHERLDYLKWIELVILKNGWDEKIVLHGLSMGAATVMMTSGEMLPSNVKAIVEDCGYTSAYDQIRYRFKEEYSIPEWFALPMTSLLTKFRAGYFFKEASAIDQVKKCKVPMLFIHGKEDNYVPYRMVFELYDACSAQKALYTVKGAKHANSLETDPLRYVETVKAFLERYVNE